MWWPTSSGVLILLLALSAVDSISSDDEDCEKNAEKEIAACGVDIGVELINIIIKLAIEGKLKHTIVAKCKHVTKVSDCLVNYADRCENYKKLVELRGFSTRYSKSANLGLCKSSSDIVKEISCLIKNTTRIGLMGCFRNYTVISSRYLKGGISKVPERGYNAVCRSLSTSVDCMAMKLAECGNLGQIFKDFITSSMSQRCYKISGYKSPTRGSASGQTSAQATLLAIAIGYLLF